MYLLGLKKAGEKKRWSTEQADPTRQANQNKQTNKKMADECQQ